MPQTTIFSSRLSSSSRGATFRYSDFKFKVTRMQAPESFRRCPISRPA